MVWYEKEHHKIHVKMSNVPIGEGETLETSWNHSSFTYSRMKVGTHHYGLRSWSTSYQLRFYLGDCGLTYQTNTFSSDP